MAAELCSLEEAVASVAAVVIAVADEANSSALEAADRATTEVAGLILVPEAAALAGRTTISLLATAMPALTLRLTGSCSRRLTSTAWLS